ncbi:MAG: Dyp-type peroxidase [Gammaproteobacteria bacterium]
MTPQAAILDPIADHARSLYFELKPGADPRRALKQLAAACDGRTALLGVGAPVAAALGASLAGLRGFPDLPNAKPAIPATQHALWLWLRGDEPGDLLHRGRALEAVAAPAFVRVQALDAYRYRDSRDLTGYEDGTENPQGGEAVAAAIAQGQGAGLDGSSFAAVQQWLHDFSAFDAMPRAEQDDCFGRNRDSNEELDDAPASAHVKRTAQEDFEPAAFVVRRSMPWTQGADAGLVFLAFGKSFDAFEALLRRMTGHDDGISDALFDFTRPLTGGYYWCPPMGRAGVDLSALGL